jgi:integral membrane protein
MTKSVKKFGLINTVEGYSFLILLFIAMPLKYILGFAIAVKIAGTIHGALFALFLGFLILAWRESKWAFGETSLFFIASLIPFGTFYTKKRIKSYE